MARLIPLWMQSGVYSAEMFRRLTGTIWPRGGLTGMAATVQAGTMNVQIAPGTAVVADSLVPGAAYLCANTGTESVALDTAPPAGQSRIDLITVQPREAQGDWIFNVITGPVSTNPANPPSPAGQIGVAQVLVEGGSPSLDQSNLTDRRSGTFGVPYRFACYLAGNPGFPNTEQAVPFSNQIEGTGLSAANWGTTNFYALPPIGGLWQIGFSVGVAPPAQNGTAYARIQINGYTVASVGQHFIGGQWGMTIAATRTYRINAWDQVRIVTAHNLAGQWIAMQGGLAGTWFQMDYIGD